MLSSYSDAVPYSRTFHEEELSFYYDIPLQCDMVHQLSKLILLLCISDVSIATITTTIVAMKVQFGKPNCQID